MISVFAIILTTFIFLIVGYPYSKLVRTQTLVGRLSLSFIVGSGLATFIWFLLYLVGLSLTLTSFILGAVIVFTVGHLIARRLPTSTTHSLHSLTKLERYLIFALILLFLIALIIAWYNPITSWDSLTLYDFRARVVSSSHSLLDIEKSTYLLSYPLMTSLMHSVVYQLGGITPQPLYTLFYLALTGVIYDYLYYFTTRSRALTASLLAMSNPYLFEHATITYSNLPYAAILVTGLLASLNSPILAGLLIGLSTWVRQSEPFWIIGIIIILLLHWSRSRYKSLLGITLAFIIRYVWQFYHSAAYLRYGFITSSTSSIYNLEIFQKVIDNLESITTYLSQFIIAPYIGIWLLLAVSLFSWRIYSRNLLVLIGALILSLGMVSIGTSIFSTYYTSWYSIGGSATRMMLFVIPLGIIVATHAHHSLGGSDD